MIALAIGVTVAGSAKVLECMLDALVPHGAPWINGRRSLSSWQWRRIARTAFFSALTWSVSMATQASTLGLEFSGTVDLSAFGVSSGSTFDGSFAWDPDQACGPGGGGEGDFPLAPLDDSPPCVTATIRIDSTSHSGFDLERSRLMLFAEGMVLQLWFEPPIDLDSGAASDVLLVELGLWLPSSDPDNPVFRDIGALPSDLSFLPGLRDRALVFSGQSCFQVEQECVQSNADTLAVVPEPSSATLILVAFSAAGIWASARRRTLRGRLRRNAQPGSRDDI